MMSPQNIICRLRRGNFAMNLFQEIEIDAAFAFGLAQPPALAQPEVPGLVAADVEALAGEMRQQFVVKPAQKRQGAGVIGRERGRVAQECAAGSFVRVLGNFRQLLQRRIFEPITQVAERVLVRDQVNAELAAARVELQDFLAGQRAPIRARQVRNFDRRMCVRCRVGTR